MIWKLVWLVYKRKSNESTTKTQHCAVHVNKNISQKHQTLKWSNGAKIHGCLNKKGVVLLFTSRKNTQNYVYQYSTMHQTNLWY